MELLDPATGKALPADAIQRVLFIANKVYVYNIPPMASMRGHNAASWTVDPARQIFTARLRVVETSYESPSAQQQLKVDVVLEDPATGQLFAASPYADAAAVEPAVDSSRFFALTVRDEAGRKAVLGVGFEERPEAFDFSIALQEARKALGWETSGDAQREGGVKSATAAAAAVTAPHKDYSLKEGETITINIGNKFGRRKQQQAEETSGPAASLQSFALAPPPSSSRVEGGSSSPGGAAGGSSADGGGGGGGGGFALPPPPRAQDVKSKRKSLMQMGFDDGQFGEFA